MASYDETTDAAPVVESQRRKGLSAKWGVIACGAGLFADGYLNAVCNRKDCRGKLTRESR
jgi:hypothetical protein